MTPAGETYETYTKITSSAAVKVNKNLSNGNVLASHLLPFLLIWLLLLSLLPSSLPPTLCFLSSMENVASSVSSW